MSSLSPSPSPTLTLPDSATRDHNIATFAGAVGGSVGFLSVLALGLCISIRYRRRRARQRDRRIHASFAETFTARDHGEDGPDNEEESAFGRSRVNGQPVMSQATPAPFVPRYFPGSTPASPPPYVADGPSIIPSPLVLSVNRAGLPVAVPSALPAVIAIPTPSLDLQRTTTGGSYADRPPPTPPDEMNTTIFGFDGARGERSLNGGIVGPLPIDSPTAEESDPMLGLDFDDDGNRGEDGPPVRMSRYSNAEDIDSDILGVSSAPRPPEASSSTSSEMASTSVAPNASLTSDSPTPSTSKSTGLLPLNLYHFTSSSTSLPIPSSPSSHLISSPSQPNLTPKPNFMGGSTSIAYPSLQPSRVPLPPSLYGLDTGSQETLERLDSRT
ncbi:hypothetical protein DFH11DRAFT_128048 [Phellopilus nigrolimitatus]|nr:hypothetical protein DFH11DRAFT_128048 [Phellopilus nigrolimitatus]